MRRTVLLFAAILLVTGISAADWTHYAGDAARSSIAATLPAGFSIAWAAQPATDEEFIGGTTPVAAGGRVFQCARRFDAGEHVGNRVIALSASTGMRLWSADLPPDQLQSWSSPAIDLGNQTVIVASGTSLTALRVSDGSVAWAANLPEPVVNASPLVTTDLRANGVAANRAFITGFSASPGAAATLSAINVDPYDPLENPYQRGGLAWSITINGLTGNSPAYDAGVLYVASTSGAITALDAATGGLVWSSPVLTHGFFGGVTIRGGFVYAGSYRFTFGQNNSRLVKLRASDGAIVWTTPCERTSTIPVVTGSGLVVLSGGIDDAGSAVKVQAWRDDGLTVTPLWDTFTATGGALWLGGWTTQPIVAGDALIVGVPAANSFSPFQSLLRIDLRRVPTDPAFIAAVADGAGGNTAAAGGMLFSYGSGGLFCLRDPGRVSRSAAPGEVVMPIQMSRRRP